MKNILLTVLNLFSLFCAAQLSENRTTNWSGAGALTSFSTDTLFFQSFLENYQNTDEALKKALEVTALQHGVLKIEKGDYYFKSPIDLPSNVALCGSGASETTFIFDLDGKDHLLRITGQEDLSQTKIVQNAAKGSNSIVLSNPSFKAGDWIKVHTNNNELITSEWAKGSVKQLVQIKSIQGNNITLHEELNLDLQLEHNPFVSLFKPVQNISIHGISIKRRDKTEAQTSHIFIRNGVHISAENLISDSCNFAHVTIEESAHIQVKGCYFKNAFGYGNGGKGYGVALQYSATQCLIENNIFQKLRHSMLVQAGANGNVFGYNYSREPFWSETVFPSGLAGDIVLHGNAPFLNLFEGNICQNIVIDDSHGKNGAFNTFFRNRAEYFGLFMNNNPASDSQNFIANELTGAGNVKVGLLSFGLGNYALSGTNHFEQYNVTRNEVYPKSSQPTQSASLYLSKIPLWWHNTTSFPFCGNSAGFNQHQNPAYLRYHYASIKTGDAPVENKEIDIVVQQDKDKIAVNWTTSATKETKSFELFWASEQNAFQPLYKMELRMGQNTPPYFYFIDFRKNLQGIQKYYIKQTFSDGTFITSKVKFIYVAGQNIQKAAAVYPNPASRFATLNMAGPIYIYNQVGALIYQNNSQVKGLEINVEDWPRGFYFITSPESNTPVKFMKN